MEKQIYDKKNGLWYELQGDYYLPCLTLPKKEHKPVGLWGQRHLRYIKQHKRSFYNSSVTSCKLNNYLTEVNEQADEMFSRLVKQLAEKENITEKLKSENQMEWVGRMNNIYASVREVIFQELICK